MPLPLPGGERDLPDPFQKRPGARTPQGAGTASAEPPWTVKRRRARIGVLVTVAVVGVVALVAYAVVTFDRALQTAFAEPGTVWPTVAAPAVPVVTPSPHDISAMVIPERWAIYPSTGSVPVAFAYDPAWTDIKDSPEDRRFQEDALATAGDNPLNAVLLLGDWQRAASATMPAMTIRVVEDPLAGRDGDLRTIVERYTNERAAAEGDDSPSFSYSGAYAHHLGYEGWRVTTWADVDGESIFITVTGIRYLDAVVFASTTAYGYAAGMQSVPASVVYLP